MALARAAPRKRFGQHFLVDDNLLRAIVRDAGPLRGVRVLEVGPGPGLLTRHLVAAGAHVVAVEIDRRMRPAAEALVEADDWRQISWIEADAMAGARRLATEVEFQLPSIGAVVSNLPYSMAGGFLGCLAERADPPARQVVMVQREIAERLRAAPGSRSYGPLAVLCRLQASVRLLRQVPPGSFWPPPKVDSVVVSLVPRPQRLDVARLGALRSFLPLAFAHRRKTLWNSIRAACEASPQLGVHATAMPEHWKKLRAESLDPVQLCEVAEQWADRVGTGRLGPDGGLLPIC